MEGRGRETAQSAGSRVKGSSRKSEKGELKASATHAPTSERGGRAAGRRPRKTLEDDRDSAQSFYSLVAFHSVGVKQDFSEVYPVDSGALLFLAKLHAAEDGSESEGGETEKEVEATFELFDPQDEDAEPLLLLMRHSRIYTQLGLQPQQLRELAKVIAGQGNIGSIARAGVGPEGRSEAPVGLMTLLSCRQYPKATEPIVSKILSLARHGCVDDALFAGRMRPRKLRRNWVSKFWQPCAQGDSVNAVSQGLPEASCALGPGSESTTSCDGASKATKGKADTSETRGETMTGLLIGCRLRNLPLEVAAEAAEALAEDVKWSLETPEMDEEERPWYRFTHVVGTALIYRDAEAEQVTKKQKRGLGLGKPRRVLRAAASTKERLSSDAPPFQPAKLPATRLSCRVPYRLHEGDVAVELASCGCHSGFVPAFAELEQEVLAEGAEVAFAAPTNQTMRFSAVPSEGGRDQEAGRTRVSVMKSLQEFLLVYAIPYDHFELNQRRVKQRLAVKASMGQL
ncbi:uncharacterized protein LOC34622560 [Cyclospora cayetanensis]|uniref:Uncharacterized protein LOC34622560 n=1 Tax=Cyclospora cayetanensis TaxID=88456 RepID=A0A6P6RXL7_9EIME|nr:uncharacterized protein LOC34622560 [Cyclospora cayetanensis]